MVDRTYSLRIGRLSSVLLVTLATVAFVSGCAPSQRQTVGRTLDTSLIAKVPEGSPRDAAADLVRVNSVTVAPIEFDRSVQVPIGTESDFLAVLTTALGQDSEFEVIPSIKLGSSGVKKQVSAHFDHPSSDGILVTKIIRYEERLGSRVGSNRPARVDFQIKLLRSGDSQTLWEANYHYEDTALSDNLLKIRESKGRGWLTARELLSSGFHAAVKDLSARRRSAFTSSL